MEAVAVLDRRMRVWDPLEGWLRMTGVLRSEWAGEPLARWLHPCDGPALIDLHRQMEHGAGCAELRLGRYGQWAPCLVQTSAWVLGGAAVSITRLPPAGATAITCATRYVYVDSAAEELLGLSARPADSLPKSLPHKRRPCDFSHSRRLGNR